MTQLAMDENEGRERAGNHADPQWFEVAVGVVWSLSRQRPSFTVHEVRTVMEARYPDLGTHDYRALGAVMATAAKQGAVERGDWVPHPAKPGSSTRQWLSTFGNLPQPAPVGQGTKALPWVAWAAWLQWEFGDAEWVGNLQAIFHAPDPEAYVKGIIGEDHADEMFRIAREVIG